MKNVRVLMKQGSQSTVATVDVERYSNQGSPADLLLRPGDTVVVPKKGGPWRSIWGGVTSVLAVTSGILGILYIVDRVRE